MKVLKSKKIFILLIPLVFVILILLYYKSLQVDLISDDYFLLYDYKLLMNPFTGNRWLVTQGFYFWLINILHFHLLPLRIFFLALEALNIFLVYFIALKFFKNRTVVALLSAFIYLIYYRQVMAVYWLAGSLEIVLATFYLAAILFFYKYLETKKIFYFFITILFFILSLITKESALTLPIILLLIDVGELFARRTTKRILLDYLILVLINCLFILILYWNSFGSTLNRGGYHPIEFQKGILNYINLLLALLPIKFDNQIILSLNQIYSVLPGFIFILFGWLTYIRKIPLRVFLILMMVSVIIIPYAFFTPFGIHDKYLTLASFAFAILLAWVIERVAFLLAATPKKNRKKLNKFSYQLIIFIIIVFWGLRSYDLISYRSNQWLEADARTKQIVNEIMPYCPLFTQDSTGYLINFPRLINNQVFIFNNGLGSMIRLKCQRNYGYYQDLDIDQKILDDEDCSGEKQDNINILVYENRKIMDKSDKLNCIKKMENEN